MKNIKQREKILNSAFDIYLPSLFFLPLSRLPLFAPLLLLFQPLSSSAASFPCLLLFQQNTKPVVANNCSRGQLHSYLLHIDTVVGLKRHRGMNSFQQGNLSTLLQASQSEREASLQHHTSIIHTAFPAFLLILFFLLSHFGEIKLERFNAKNQQNTQPIKNYRESQQMKNAISAALQSASKVWKLQTSTQ